MKAGLATGEVWNTYPLNDCPQATWKAIDAKKLATENNLPIAMLNGPRYWLMNSVEKAGGEVDLPKKNFGGLEMYRQATVELGLATELAKPAKPYVLGQSFGNIHLRRWRTRLRTPRHRWRHVRDADLQRTDRLDPHRSAAHRSGFTSETSSRGLDLQFTDS